MVISFTPLPSSIMTHESTFRFREKYFFFISSILIPLEVPDKMSAEKKLLEPDPGNTGVGKRDEISYKFKFISLMLHRKSFFNFIII